MAWSERAPGAKATKWLDDRPDHFARQSISRRRSREARRHGGTKGRNQGIEGHRLSVVTRFGDRPSTSARPTRFARWPWHPSRRTLSAHGTHLARPLDSRFRGNDGIRTLVALAHPFVPLSLRRFLHRASVPSLRYFVTPIPLLTPTFQNQAQTGIPRARPDSVLRSGNRCNGSDRPARGGTSPRSARPVSSRAASRRGSILAPVAE